MDNNLNIKTVHICRTCTEEIINTSFFYLDFTQIDSEPTIGQKLSNCIPELDLSIVPNTVICGKCADTITSLYIFKKECLQFEMQIREYIQQVHHTDNVIDLAAVMQFHQLHSNDFTTQLTTEAFEKIETETENYKIEELTTSFCDNYAVNETEENTATGVFVKMENYTNEESTSSYDYYAVNKTERKMDSTPGPSVSEAFKKLAKRKDERQNKPQEKVEIDLTSQTNILHKNQITSSTNIKIQLQVSQNYVKNSPVKKKTNNNVKKESISKKTNKGGNLELINKRKLAAEKKRKQRERMRADPEAYELYKKRERERSRKRKECGKITSITEKSPSDQRRQRKLWRVATRKYNARKKERQLNEETLS